MEQYFPDILIAVVLIFCIYSGIKKGLIRSVAGILVLIISITGAAMLTRSLTPPVTSIVAPVTETILQDNFDEVYSTLDKLPDQTTVQSTVNVLMNNDELKELFDKLSIDESDLTEAFSSITDATQNLADSTIEAIAYSITEPIVSFLLWFVLISLLNFVLNIIVNSLNLVAKLPVLRLGNKLGGGIIGFIRGVIFVWIIVAVVNKFQLFTLEEGLESTYLLHYFVNFNLIELLGLSSL